MDFFANKNGLQIDSDLTIYKVVWKKEKSLLYTLLNILVIVVIIVITINKFI